MNSLSTLFVLLLAKRHLFIAYFTPKFLYVFFEELNKQSELKLITLLLNQCILFR